MGRTNQLILKVKPYVFFMIAHSILFLLLNITDNSPLTMRMSTTLETIIVLSGLVFIVAGMFMVFIIVFEIMNGLTGNTNKKLYNLVNIMMLLFIFAGISAVFNFMPILATIIMSALLLLEVFFLISYYYVFLTKSEKLT